MNCMRLVVSSALLGLGLAGCYAHAAHPGQVTVVEYGPARDTAEVELDAMGWTDEEGDVWLSASGEFTPQGCSPVALDVRRGDAPASDVRFRNPHGTFAVRDGTLDVNALRLALAARPVDLSYDGNTVRLHDEHLYNLEAFATEMRCPAQDDTP